MISIAGIINFFCPKNKRLRTDIPSPARAGIWVGAAFHCSTNKTTKSATKTKSSPWVLKVKILPNIAPSQAKNAQ